MNESTDNSAKPKQGILSVTIKDKSALYSAYMPFLKNGGLFVATEKNYKMGEEVFLLVRLVDESEKMPVSGNVTWITPKGSQGSRPAGIGVHFSSEDKGQARSKVESYLAGSLNSDRATHTM